LSRRRRQNLERSTDVRHRNDGIVREGQARLRPSQPHIVQLGAVLFEAESGIELASINLTIKPEGWKIPDEVAMLHGITHDQAMEVGIPIRTAMKAFLDLAKVADLLCAHNIQFDDRMVTRELFSSALDHGALKDKKRFCTMLESNKIIKKGKFPKLKEAFFFFFGEEMTGAHNAMNDIRACDRIRREIATYKKTLKEGSKTDEAHGD